MTQYKIENDPKYISDRKKSFDLAADFYDKYRPNYPKEVFEWLIKATKLSTNAKVLEIGCGTGQATFSLLDAGFKIQALDISPKMIAILKKKKQINKNLVAHVMAFEECEFKPKTFDLIFSSQAKHWIDNDILYSKSAALLKSSGHICWVSNNLLYLDKTIRQKFNQLYKKYFMIMAKRDGGPLGDTANYLEKIKKEIAQSGFFEEAQLKKIPWKIEYTADQYVGLLKSQSDHILQGKKINQLLEGIHKAILDNGGSLFIRYEACVGLAQKRKS